MIDKRKGDSMTQEEELKIGEVGYKKSSYSSERKSRRGKAPLCGGVLGCVNLLGNKLSGMC